MPEINNQYKNEEIVSSRFSKSMIVGCLAGSIVHLLLSIFYFIIKVPEMFIFAIITAFLFLLWRHLFKNKLIETSFILASLNAVIGIVLGEYFIGWESNFNIYFIILPASLFLYNGWKVWKRSVYLITLFFLYLLLYFVLSDFEGVYKINEDIIKYLSLVNTLSAVTIILMILLSFNSSIIQMQNNLENRNRDLKQKAKELDYSLNKEKQLGQLKNSFVSTASHQFRTPLAVIQSNTELIEMLTAKDNVKDAEKYKKITSRITIAISKMTGLMDSVLTLGKINSGNIYFTPVDIDLVAFCDKLVKDFNLIQQDGRSLELVLQGTPRKIFLDSKLLGHILSNLADNAFKYSIGKANPQLRVQFNEKDVIISVKDFGIGISEEEKLKLFEPFYRAENSEEIQGTGLGLSIAKEYIEMSNGKIEVSSILDQGSCFEITFATPYHN